MKTLSHNLLSTKKEKHHKLSQRFIKALKSGSFKSHSKRKQYIIVERIKKLERQLREYRENTNRKFSISFRHWAVALALGVVSYGASAQDKPSKPEKRSPFKIEKERDKERLKQNYLRARASENARVQALDFELAALIGDAPVANQAYGDFDNDGDVDIMYSPEVLNTVYRFRNDGNFIFEREEVNIDVNWEDPIVFDVDNDGDLDIMVEKGNHGDYYEASSLIVLTNDGTGAFATGSEISLSGDVYYLKTGDLDSDGDIDLVTFNGSYNKIYGSVNDGSGNFSNIELADSTYRLHAIGDLDGDGDLDIVASENYKVYDYYGNYYTKYRKTIFHNDGTGTFIPSGISMFQYNDLQTVEAIDIDLDGDVDIVNFAWYWDGYESTHQVEVFLNDGTGVFADPLISNTSDYFYEPHFLDIDGDNDIDIISGEYSEQVTPVLLNDGSGNFNLSYLNVTPGAQAAGDLDGDGDVDIASFSYVHSDIWRNEGNLEFTLMQSNILEMATALSVGIVDLNGDGAGEILQIGASKVWQNSGDSENFTVTQRLNTIDSDHALADIDNDGDIDLVTAVYSHSGHIANVWRNDNGTFNRADSLGLEGDQEAYRITVGDIDQDGDIDLAVLSESDWNSDGVFSNIISFWVNDGSGTFTHDQTIDNNKYYNDIHLADMDNDGDPDIVALPEYNSVYTTGISIFINDGTGTFTLVESAATFNEDFEEFAIEDFDKDGDLDVFAVGDDYNYMFLNDGTGAFSSSPVEEMTVSDGQVVAGDMDNDGDEDLVISFYSYYNGIYYSEKQVFLNDGTGNFTNSLVNMKSQGYEDYGLNVGDIDNDGDLDIVSGSIYTPLELWRNNLYQVDQLEQDKQALTALYNVLGGENWSNNTNWLSEDVSTWHGITVENGRVTFLQLPDNNLSGDVPESLLDLSGLTHLDLSGNSLTAIPDLSAITSLVAADVSDNTLDFGDLEPNADVSFLIYSPQAQIGVQDEIKAAVHSEVILSENISGTANSYQWYFNEELLEGATNPQLIISDVTGANMGNYKVEITNGLLPDLIIVSASDRLNVTADISGTILDEEGGVVVAATDVILLKLTSSNGFDTVDIVNPNVDGFYTFEDVLLSQYLILSDPDVGENPNLLPTFYPNYIYWEEADTVNITDNLTDMDITVEIFEQESLNGTGELFGTVWEEEEEGGRLQVKKRVAGAGVSVRRKTRAGRKIPGTGKMLADYELVAYLKTNENGEFLFEQLPADIFRLNIQYPGYPMDTTSFVDISIGKDSKGGTKENDKVAVEALVAEDKIVVKNVTVVAITNNLYTSSINVYPNPTNGKLYINSSESHMDIDAHIYDIKGILILDRKIHSALGEIDLTSLQKGTYILKLYFENKDNHATYKIIID